MSLSCVDFYAIIYPCEPWCNIPHKWIFTGNFGNDNLAACMLSLLIKKVKISGWILKYKYKYNPISSTYMRYVNEDATWDEAKEGCESEGEC